MFRSLLLFPPGYAPPVKMEAPLSVTLVDGPNHAPVELAIKPEAVFTTAVGHSSKRTLAVWHVTTPQEIVDHMLELVGVAAQDVSSGETILSEEVKKAVEATGGEEKKASL